MNDPLKSVLQKMGLHVAWLEYGFIDEQFARSVYQKAARPLDEHCRIPFYSKFFSDRTLTGIANDEMEQYLVLVEYETDRALQSWALGFLIEFDSLTKEQLERLSQHRLVNELAKRMPLLSKLES